MASIDVHVRLRPLQQGEGLPAWDTHPSVIYSTNGSSFHFNHVHGPKVSNDEMFKDLQPTLDAAFQGRTVTVMAYGQTGSGKTHTMLGPAGTRDGLMVAASKYLNAVCKSRGYTLELTYTEVYNETLTDLMADDGGTEITIREAPDGSIVQEGIVVAAIENHEQALQEIDIAEGNRKYATTGQNERSSRSHTLLSFDIVKPDETRLSSVTLVDLAGSESAARANTVDARRREGGFINKSLLALGNVVDAIVDNRPHIPYRDSKLTRLLRNSFASDALTVIVCCVSPCELNMEQTMSSLRFAHRAMKIKKCPHLVTNYVPVLCDGVTEAVKGLIPTKEFIATSFEQGLCDAYDKGREMLTEIQPQFKTVVDDALDELDAHNAVWLARYRHQALGVLHERQQISEKLLQELRERQEELRRVKKEGRDAQQSYESLLQETAEQTETVERIKRRIAERADRRKLLYKRCADESLEANTELLTQQELVERLKIQTERSEALREILVPITATASRGRSTEEQQAFVAQRDQVAVAKQRFEDLQAALVEADFLLRDDDAPAAAKHRGGGGGSRVPTRSPSPRFLAGETVLPASQRPRGDARSKSRSVSRDIAATASHSRAASKTAGTKRSRSVTPSATSSKKSASQAAPNSKKSSAKPSSKNRQVGNKENSPASPIATAEERGITLFTPRPKENRAAKKTHDDGYDVETTTAAAALHRHYPALLGDTIAGGGHHDDDVGHVRPSASTGVMASSLTADDGLASILDDDSVNHMVSIYMQTALVKKQTEKDSASPLLSDAVASSSREVSQRGASKASSSRASKAPKAAAPARGKGKKAPAPKKSTTTKKLAGKKGTTAASQIRRGTSSTSSHVDDSESESSSSEEEDDRAKRNGSRRATAAQKRTIAKPASKRTRTESSDMEASSSSSDDSTTDDSMGRETEVHAGRNKASAKLADMTNNKPNGKKAKAPAAKKAAKKPPAKKASKAAAKPKKSSAKRTTVEA